MSSEVETSPANVRQPEERLFSAAVYEVEVDGLLSCQLLQTQIVKDGKSGLADCVGSVAASTLFRMKAGRLTWNRRRYDSTTQIQGGLNHAIGIHSLRARESATAWTTRM
jgi:hypothetical protein